MHVKLADESICVGGALPNESYLNIPSIMSAINITNADAVHPGYGFLSENDKFAKILSSHKVKFIGPSSKSILELGNKSNALKLASKFKLPILGSKNMKNISNNIEAKKIADEIGTPICITVDFETIENDTVTIRDRDTMSQKRVSSQDLILEYKKVFN